MMKRSLLLLITVLKISGELHADTVLSQDSSFVERSLFSGAVSKPKHPNKFAMSFGICQLRKIIRSVTDSGAKKTRKIVQ